MRFARWRAGGAEHADFSEGAVVGKNFCGIPHFLERPIHQLQSPVPILSRAIFSAVMIISSMSSGDFSAPQSLRARGHARRTAHRSRLPACRLIVSGARGKCLECADLDHLEFLPTGDAALTDEPANILLNCCVLKWSRARKRYERQGLLVETQGLERAEEECLADSEVRERRGSAKLSVGRNRTVNMSINLRRT